MFVVFYTVNIVYICVFMTCSTSYCLCDTLMDTWTVCIYVCFTVHFWTIHPIVWTTHTTLYNITLQFTSRFHISPLLSRFCEQNPTHIYILLIAKMLYPFHSQSLDEPNNFWWSSLSCNFLQPSVTSSAFGSHILLSTLFSIKLNSSMCGWVKW